MNFTDLQNVCKYAGSAYNVDNSIIDVCRNPNGVCRNPEVKWHECWKLCDEEHCPLMKVERNDANEMPCSP